MCAVLDLLAVVFIGLHFGTPLVYFIFVKKQLNQPWNIKMNTAYRPRASIIIPTYREAKHIVAKLDNVYSLDYPKDLVEIVVVDSGSDDGTAELVEKWAVEHPEVNLKLLREPVRRGMNPAINFALKHVSDDVEIIVFTDADSYWQPYALKNVMKYFADPIVGAVTASTLPLEDDEANIERTYRNYYNATRVGESKYHSTPVHNGVLVAYRLKLIQRIGGIPEYTGNNDSTPASIIAFMGYRAIQADDVIAREPLRRRQFKRKIRRAQHLLLSFLKTKRYVKDIGVYVKSSFDNVWRIEQWLHIVNPWFLLFGTILFTSSLVLYGSMVALTCILAGFALFGLRAYKTWVIQQIYLIAAAIRNLWTKEILWTK